ncbi:37S ribosomal protein S9, mitochondrial [Pestalotiopsis sp. 9143b]|nr:37S ribosomal protein S9, mitochondrial [Pestalotiopsis sp. 9143b]
MSTLRHTVRCLRDIRPTAKSQWGPSTVSLAIRPKPQNLGVCRAISTTSPKLAIESNDTTNEPTKGFPELEAAALQVGGPGAGSVVPPEDMLVNAPYARAVPVSPSYFSRLPFFMDSFVVVQELARKYARLPTLPKEKVAPVAWRTREQYRLATGEQVKGKDYASCLGLVKRLNQIHPDLMPEEVTEGLQTFKRDVNHYLNKPKAIPVDKFGRAVATGKRKTSVARAYVIEGTGEVFVNGKPLSDAFGRVHDRESAVWALKSTERLDKYNVWATISGGGTTGQAEAMTLAVAKALCAHEPALKNPLRRGKMITFPRICLKAEWKPFWDAVLACANTATGRSRAFASTLE